MKAKRKSKTRQSIGRPLTFFIFFATFWTIITGTFDIITYRDSINQQAALSFPTTTGKVLQSAVESVTDSDGTAYRAEVQFEYQVNNQTYQSDNYRFGTMAMSDSTEANRVVNTYPVGANVTVYYDPANPSRAILEPGVAGIDQFMLLFLVPFNVIGLANWAIVIQMIYVLIAKPPAGGIAIHRRKTLSDGTAGSVVHVRLARISPIVAAVLGGGVVCFLSVFIGGFAMAMNPPMWFIKTVWVTAFVVAAFVYIWRSLVVGSGSKDLIIDHENRVLGLPQTSGRTKQTLIPFDAIKDIKLKCEVSYSANGQSETWVPTLILKPGDAFTDEVEKEEHRTKITEMMFAYKAEALVDWLRTELRLDNT